MLSERALFAGIEAIASEIAAETVPDNVLRDLKKLKQADFTVERTAGLEKTQAGGFHCGKRLR